MEYKIYVGTLQTIKMDFLKIDKQIVYSGMCNQSTFVVSPHIGFESQGYSPSIYYNIDSTAIQVLDITFDVVEVTTKYIILRH